MKYLPVNKEQIPVKMSVPVEGKQYEFLFEYNSTYDFFTVSLFERENEIITGEKIVLGMPLFSTIGNPFDKTYFIPMDLSEEETRITYDSFGERVFIWVFTVVDGQVIEDE